MSDTSDTSGTSAKPPEPHTIPYTLAPLPPMPSPNSREKGSHQAKRPAIFLDPAKPLNDDELFLLWEKNPAALAEMMRTQPTDLGNGDRLVQRFGDKIRYDKGHRRWRVYDPKIGAWRFDQGDYIRELAKITAKAIYGEAMEEKDKVRSDELGKWAKISQKDSAISAMIRQAQSVPAIVSASSEFDANQFQINLVNGTYDLIDDRLIEHSPSHLVTKLAPVAYDPAATCPNWLAFLDMIAEGDQEKLSFLQEYAGLILTGHPSESFIIFIGRGANGKTTYIETLAETIGNDKEDDDYLGYAMAVKPETLLAMRSSGGASGSSHDADLVDLRGMRFAHSLETPKEAPLNESRIKALTSAAKISARPLYGRPITFMNRAKMALDTNYEPLIKGTDEGIRRRVIFMPFDYEIPEDERVENFRDKVLTPERAGILNWALEGHRRIRARGYKIVPPSSAIEKTRTFHNEMSAIRQFVDARCQLDAKATMSADDLYRDYIEWAENDAGIRMPLTKFKFSKELQFELRLTHGPRLPSGHFTWRGIQLNELGRPAEMPAAQFEDEF